MGTWALFRLPESDGKTTTVDYRIIARLLLVVVLSAFSFLFFGLPPVRGQENTGTRVAETERPAPELYLFDFFSPVSGDCAHFKPVLTKVERRFAGRVRVIHVDADLPQNKPFVDKLGVRDVPTLIVVNKEGDQLKTLVGSEEGNVIGILLEILLPDADARKNAASDIAQGPFLPVVLTKQEAKLDPGQAEL